MGSSYTGGGRLGDKHLTSSISSDCLNTVIFMDSFSIEYFYNCRSPQYHRPCHYRCACSLYFYMKTISHRKILNYEKDILYIWFNNLLLTMDNHYHLFTESSDRTRLPYISSQIRHYYASLF